MCGGYYPAFDEMDQKTYRIWKDDRDAGEALRREEWKTGG